MPSERRDCWRGYWCRKQDEKRAASERYSDRRRDHWLLKRTSFGIYGLWWSRARGAITSTISEFSFSEYFCTYCIPCFISIFWPFSGTLAACEHHIPRFASWSPWYTAGHERVSDSYLCWRVQGTEHSWNKQNVSVVIPRTVLENLDKCTGLCHSCS